jgi:nucleolar protein 56
MKAVIVQFPFGILAFGPDNQLVGKAIFAKKPQTAAKAISQLNEGTITQELEILLTQLQTEGYDTFTFENPQLAEETKTKLNLQTQLTSPAQAEELRTHAQHLAIEIGFAKTTEDLATWNRNVTMELAKLQVKGATQKRDLVVGQAIQTLDDLDRTLNLFMGRMREWYGVHFPELDRLVEKHETYARLVVNLGNRENFTQDNLQKEDLPQNKTEIISRVAATSMGADITETDLTQIQNLGKDTLNLYKLRETMETYLERTMQEIAPNTKTIAGALLGARLIAIAGGLHNLATRPASTLQVLGAEKALFRSLKTGARPPKHGLIFQHTLLHDAKRWQRGKIARAIAGKLAIAVRADAFGEGRYVADKLKAQLDRRIEEIRTKYAEPPPAKEQKPREQRPREFQQRPQFRREGGNSGGFRGGGERRDFNRRDRDNRGADRKWRQNRRAGKS